MRRVKMVALVMMGSTLVFCSTTHGGEDTTSRVRGRLSQGYESAPAASELEPQVPHACRPWMSHHPRSRTGGGERRAAVPEAYR